jgi:hypothetical protein
MSENDVKFTIVPPWSYGGAAKSNPVRAVWRPCYGVPDQGSNQSQAAPTTIAIHMKCFENKHSDHRPAIYRSKSHDKGVCSPASHRD